MMILDVWLLHVDVLLQFQACRIRGCLHKPPRQALARLARAAEEESPEVRWWQIQMDFPYFPIRISIILYH